MAQQYFHFTLGPVQGFVAQARRTRDFWAGSFLLSWLSGVAMAEIQRQGGKISFPIPAENYLDWITGKTTGEKPPRQGAIPNRFKANSAKVPDGFDGEQVEIAIREAWVALADHVWRKDELAATAKPNTKEIWDRQHNNFWEISWVLTEDIAASALLDQRKNWRSSYHQAEGGVKCMVMGGWQELSGAHKPSEEVLVFWEKVRKNGKSGMKTDLAINEHLSGLAYVKRRFVRHFESFNASLSTGLTLKGWHLQAGIPSVSYMAAVHWLEALAKIGSAEELSSIVEAAEKVTRYDEWDTRIACLESELFLGKDKVVKKLVSLDGNLFFEHVQENAKSYGYDDASVKTLQKEISRFKQAHTEFSAPLSPFYAVLLMDGDSLGVHMADINNQESISTALNQFTANVPEIVEKHNGFLIYAGGDDVLAILPLEDAMQCAANLRAEYLNCFKPYPAITTSISSAIEYADVKMPLMKVLHDAHGLLDDVAKDGAGRDALAVRVWKPGGMTIEWAQPWEIALENNELVIEQLVKAFEAEGSEFSNKFFYKISERFDLLNPTKNQAGGYTERILKDDEAIDLLAVDFKNSGENRKENTIENAKQKITPLLKQCRAVKRDKDKPKSEWKTDDLLRADGAMLIRFLAKKGVQ